MEDCCVCQHLAIKQVVTFLLWLTVLFEDGDGKNADELAVR